MMRTGSRAAMTLWLATVMGGALFGQNLSREYIRLGGRVIAIETPGPVVTPNVAILAALEQQTFQVTSPTGVTFGWQILSGGGGGTLNATSGASVTYQAPASATEGTGPTNSATIRVCVATTSNCADVVVRFKGTASGTLTIAFGVNPYIGTNAGQTLSLTTTLPTGDVRWTVANGDGSFQGGAGGTVTTTGTHAVTYIAPSTVAADRPVSVQACSVNSPGVCGTATVNLKAIGVELTMFPASMLVGSSGSGKVRVTGVQAGASAAVDIALMGGGTPATTRIADASGEVVFNFTAPASGTAMSITATPVQDPAKATSVTVQLTSLVLLSGSAQVTPVTGSTADITLNVTNPNGSAGIDTVTFSLRHSIEGGVSCPVQWFRQAGGTYVNQVPVQLGSSGIAGAPNCRIFLASSSVQDLGATLRLTLRVEWIGTTVLAPAELRIWLGAHATNAVSLDYGDAGAAWRPSAATEVTVAPSQLVEVVPNGGPYTLIAIHHNPTDDRIAWSLALAPGTSGITDLGQLGPQGGTCGATSLTTTNAHAVIYCPPAPWTVQNGRIFIRATSLSDPSKLFNVTVALANLQTFPPTFESSEALGLETHNPNLLDPDLVTVANQWIYAQFGASGPPGGGAWTIRMRVDDDYQNPRLSCRVQVFQGNPVTQATVTMDTYIQSTQSGQSPVSTIVPSTTLQTGNTDVCAMQWPVGRALFAETNCQGTCNNTFVRVPLDMKFPTTFVGRRHVWLEAQKGGGLGTSWQYVGSFTVTPGAGLAVSPATVTLNAGQTQAFTISGAAATWTLPNAKGEFLPVQTPALMTATGTSVTYKAPGSVPADDTATVQACQGTPQVCGIATVTLRPILVSFVAPNVSALAVGAQRAYTVSVAGVVSGASSAIAVESATGGTATVSGSTVTFVAGTAAGTATLKVKSVQDPSRFAEISFPILAAAPPTVSPQAATVGAGQTAQFVLTGPSGFQTSWTVVGNKGSVSQTGGVLVGNVVVYTAPQTVAAADTARIDVCVQGTSVCSAILVNLTPGSGGGGTITLTPTERELLAAGESGKTFTVSPASGWSALSRATWIPTVTSSGSTVTYGAGGNSGTISRAGQIEVSGTGLATANHTVFQKPTGASPALVATQLPDEFRTTRTQVRFELRGVPAPGNWIWFQVGGQLFGPDAPAGGTAPCFFTWSPGAGNGNFQLVNEHWVTGGSGASGQTWVLSNTVCKVESASMTQWTTGSTYNYTMTATVELLGALAAARRQVGVHVRTYNGSTYGYYDHTTGYWDPAVPAAPTVTPQTATLGAGQTAQFTATAPAGMLFNWTVVNSRGTISAGVSAAGSAVTYTAPATVSAAETVTLNACVQGTAICTAVSINLTASGGGGGGTLTLTPPEVARPDGNAFSSSFTVSPASGWTAGSFANWVTLGSISGATVNYSATANNTGLPRAGAVEVRTTGGAATAYHTVIQPPQGVPPVILATQLPGEITGTRQQVQFQMRNAPAPGTWIWFQVGGTLFGPNDPDRTATTDGPLPAPCFFTWSPGGASGFFQLVGHNWVTAPGSGTSGQPFVLSNEACKVESGTMAVTTSGGLHHYTVNVTVELLNALTASRQQVGVHVRTYNGSSYGYYGNTTGYWNPFNPIRINAGGPTWTDPATGDVWVSDGTGPMGGSAIFPGVGNPVPGSIPILGTTTQELYRLERYTNPGPMTYQYTVPNGNYRVTLKFAEISTYEEPDPSGGYSRKFHVDINGARRISNLDVRAEAGGAFYKAVDKEFLVTVTTGQIAITLSETSPRKSSAILSALKIEAAP